MPSGSTPSNEQRYPQLHQCSEPLHPDHGMQGWGITTSLSGPFSTNPSLCHCHKTDGRGGPTAAAREGTQPRDVQGAAWQTVQGDSTHFLAKVNSSEPEYTQLGTEWLEITSAEEEGVIVMLCHPF